MALKNGKSLKKALKEFVKVNGREPNIREFRDMLNGRLGKINA